MRLSVRLVVLAFVVLLATAFAELARAQVPVSLTGEVLTGIPTNTAYSCAQGGEFGYTITGTATGPYPGTFTETLSYTFLGAAQNQKLTASFIIQSPNGTVTGTKTLRSGIGGFCNSLVKSTSVQASVSYEATIQTANDLYRDQGNGTIDIGYSEVPTSTTYFTETFTSTSLVSLRPSFIALSPPAATNTIGEEHCVTASVFTPNFDPVGAGVAVGFTVTGANSASGNTMTDANGQAEFCYTGTNAGVDTITAIADSDRDGTPETGEATNTATKTYVNPSPTTVAVTPASDTNTVGDQHCVTATATDASGHHSGGYTVTFTVTGTTSGRDRSTGTATTDSSGQATFCYTAQFPGADTITAVVDANKNGTAETTEPRGTATKTYVLPVSTPLCQVSISTGGWIVSSNGDRATFGGVAKVTKDSHVQGEEVYEDHGPAANFTMKSIQVLAVACSGNEATIYGTATINGQGQFFFRIHVTDVNKSGKGDTYGILLSNGYYSGDQPLRGGNITILRK